jgi:hypothetical protein
MIRSVCQYQTSLERCSKQIRARRAHLYCREHYKLVKHESRSLNRIKKVKIIKVKAAVEVKERRKK